MFQDLITQLKKVKSDKDITPQLLDELINAGIAGAVHMVRNGREEASMIEAIEIARMSVLKHFDQIMFDAMLEEDDVDDL